MLISEYIEGLIAHAKQSQLPQSFKNQVVQGLDYFLRQSLCHGDRRDPANKIKASWLELDTMLIGTGLFDKFKSDKSQWNQFMSYLGIENLPTYMNKPPPTKPKQKFGDRTAEELMNHLARKAEQRASFSDAEKNVVCLGLYYLELEARRGRGQRNNKRIKYTWQLIQPILRRLGMLDEFNGEPEAVQRIKFFISDKFL